MSSRWEKDKEFVYFPSPPLCLLKEEKHLRRRIVGWKSPSLGKGDNADKAIALTSVAPFALSSNKTKGEREINGERGNWSALSQLAAPCQKYVGSSWHHHKLGLNGDISPLLLRNSWLACPDAPFRRLAAHPVTQLLSWACQTSHPGFNFGYFLS